LLECRLTDTCVHLYTGLKPPLDYSVFSASACALLLALHEHRGATSRDGGAEVPVKALAQR
jgi:hypothetical protein